MVKHLLAFILLISGPAAAFCQELTDSVNLPSSGKVTVVRDTVTLSGAETSPQDGQQNLPLASTEVGRTPGELSVSPSGGATYTVPIAVPPGINGVQPEIALVYNSQGGNGIAGWGWNLSGLSVITRVAATPFHDGTTDGVDFDALDRFALDGKRLMLKSGSYGENGAQYETEIYSNIKITSHGVSPYGAAYGPAYFKVTYPDGSFAFYGQTANSRTQMDFAITYWQNPQNVRVSYTYVKAGNGLSVSSIKYGARGATGTPMNELQFVYSTRKRAEQAYLGGVRFIRNTILSAIKCIGNGSGYRNYDLAYNQTALGYQRLHTVTEKSGDNTKSYNPLTFNYTTSSGTVAASDIDFDIVGDFEQRNSDVISLDYTGDGKMDFIVFPKGPKNEGWLFANFAEQNPIGTSLNTGSFTDIFPMTYLTHNQKVLPGQGLVLVKPSGNSQVTFQVAAYSAAVNFLAQYSRSWNFPVYSVEYDCNGAAIEHAIPKKYISGDFNGDGLTDVIAVSEPYTAVGCEIDPGCNPLTGDSDTTGNDPAVSTFVHQAQVPNPATSDSLGNAPADEPADPCCTCNPVTYANSSVYFVNLDRRLTSNYVTVAGSLQAALNIGEKLLAADLNGDGKTDILHIENGHGYVYHLTDAGSIELLWHTADSRFSTSLPPMLGDYNGDGKTDILFPTAAESAVFAMFLSSGSGFIKAQTTYPFTYKETNYNGTGTLYGYSLIPVDINGDGKTDVLDYRTTTYNGSTSGTQTVTLYNNTWSAAASANPAFVSGGSVTRSGNLEHFPIPVFLTVDKPNFNLEFASISNSHVTSFQFLKDHREDMLLRSVQNDGLTHAISYAPLVSGSLSSEGEMVYTAQGNEAYPYIDIRLAPGTKIVSRLRRTGIGPAINQFYFYNGAVSHFGGLGFSGFKKRTKTNWHADVQDRIYQISLQDPALRGAAIKEFTSRQSYISPPVENTEPSPSNVSLSAPSSGNKTVVATQSVRMLPGFSAKGSGGTFIARLDVATGVADGGALADYITRTDYKYTTLLKSNKVFVNVPSEVAVKDLLAGTNVVNSLSYDAYYNPVKEITYFMDQGSKEVVTTYANSTGSTYFVGRPTKKITTSRSGGDVYTTEEQYSYTGYLPTQTKTRGHNTAFITETRQYDIYGNVTSKTIAPPGSAARTTSFSYEGTGRFRITSTDVEGLTTTYQYDLSTGNVVKETNPYNLSTDFQYDAWGKLISATDYLGNQVLTTYQKSGTQHVITETADDGSASETTYDLLGRAVKARKKNVMNQWVAVSSEYDSFDRKTRQSEPYTGAAPTQWSQTEYDEYGRVKQTIQHTGETTNISYNKLVTTVNDGVKTVIKTQDALGNVVKVADPGGTINYTYYANGNQKAASYDGVTLTTEQDGWGRKIKLTDPSAGVYTYAYNGFGEITQETTPKGSTTYTYDATGKLLTKKVVGDETDMLLQHTYNATTKLLTSLSLTNADGNDETYTYTYDTYKRLSSTVENNSQARFTKNYTYDSFGRIMTENFKAENHATGKTSIKKIKNTYQNGMLKSIADDASGAVIWAVTAVNARGQLTGASLGAAITQVNTYDQYGFPTEFKTQKTSGGTQIARFGFSFQATRGTLNSRSSSLFSWNETFSYDNLDRLTAFNDNAGNKSQTYDNKGRIVSNSAVGTYVYSSASYRHGSIYLTGGGTAHYQARPLQQISYNAFKSPVEIIEQGHERISFQYNASLGRSHMYYGGQQVDKMQRRYRKHYSADGSMEITHDTQSGKTTFVAYIGGDAYSAPAIWKEEYAGATTAKKLYYLHRDYLGSILAITDQSGALKEKRHFDAWGNIVKLTDGTGAALDYFVILDRGYTGHEHLLGVGLIHMNGRLYDPVLHRFLSPDNYMQDPFNTQNFNRFGYALNNPLMYTDPDGELAWFIPVIIGAFIGGASQAIAGGDFWDIAGGALIGGVGGFVGGGIANLISGGAFLGSGVAASMSIGGIAAGGATSGFIGSAGTAWLGGASFGEGMLGGLKGGLLGGLGAGLGTIGGGSFFANLAFGISQGAITGGLGALLSGGDIGKGLLYGAAIGGTFSAVTSGMEAYSNYKGGYGFRTNNGVIRHYIKNKQFQNAIDFVKDTYGLQGPNMTYKKNLADYGTTDPITGDIQIGDAFDSPGVLKATIVHEYGHSTIDRILDPNGRFTNWKYENYSAKSVLLELDGPVGYGNEILNSGRFHIPRNIITGDNRLWSEWNSLWGSKFLHILPRRFDHSYMPFNF